MTYRKIRQCKRSVKESSRRYRYHRWWPARAVVELAGIKNIRTKSLGSNNKTNVVLATVAGLTSLKTPEEIAKLRGKSVEEILG